MNKNSLYGDRSRSLEIGDYGEIVKLSQTLVKPGSFGEVTKYKEGTHLGDYLKAHPAAHIPELKIERLRVDDTYASYRIILPKKGITLEEFLWWAYVNSAGSYAISVIDLCELDVFAKYQIDDDFLMSNIPDAILDYRIHIAICVGVDDEPTPHPFFDDFIAMV